MTMITTAAQPAGSAAQVAGGSPLPTLSIVIVSWNGRQYLAECLESLAGVAYAGPIETIVVDNASSDGSAEMVSARFPRVTLIRNAENLGFAKANNIGVRQCTGDYIALINSDVHVAPGCLASLVVYCQATPRAGLVGPFVIGGDGKPQSSCRSQPTLWKMLCRAVGVDVLFPRSRWLSGYYMNLTDRCAPRSVDILSGCFWLTSRRALSEVGLLDESFFIYGEDMDWCKRFRNAGWDVVFVPKAEAIHYGGASSSNEPLRFYLEKQKAELQYWRKHHSRGAVKGYLAMTLLYHVLRIGGYAVKWSLVRKTAETSRYKIRRSVVSLRWLLSGE